MDQTDVKHGRRKPPTARQVADAARVSIATVSRVINGKGGVSDELTARVRKAIAELGFSPNRIARGFRRQRMQTIGVIVTDIQNPFFTSVLQSIERVLESGQYGLLLCNSDEQPEREQTHLTTLSADNVAGIILAPTRGDAFRYQAVIDSGIPLVVIDREVQGLKADCLTINNFSAGIMAVNHLVEAGHKRIGLITGPGHATTANQRRAGYLAGLGKAGLPVNSQYIKEADFKHRGGYRAMHELLRLPEPPSAVVVSNNLMTLGALQAINEKGISVPQDMALLGFDDMPWATSLRPPLTVIAQPTLALGEYAAQLLIARLNDPSRPFQTVILEATLVVRESTTGPQT